MTTETKRCPFCGETYDTAKGCSCTLGKLATAPVTIPHICGNCVFLQDGCCVYDAVMNPMDLEKTVRRPVLDPRHTCFHWELDLDIFKDLVKKEGV